jgi:hypothetical protein
MSTVSFPVASLARRQNNCRVLVPMGTTGFQVGRKPWPHAQCKINQPRLRPPRVDKRARGAPVLEV